MRILFTCNFSPWSSYSGGGQRSTHNLACALARRGHEVIVIFTRPPWEEVQVPPGLPYTVRWATLLSLRGKSPGLWRLSSGPTVAKLVASITADGKPTVVHAQGEEAALLPWLRKLRRFGLVVTSRYPSFPQTLLHWGDSSLAQRARVLWGDTKYLALGRALRGADFCCPPSEFGGRLIQAAYGLSPQRIVPVHNGVPQEFLAHQWQVPRTASELRERPLLFFGRFSHDKGIDDVIAAVARIPDVQVQLVGRGPLQGAIAAQVTKLELGARVRFHGWASHDELGALLSRAAVAVLPSHDENFSLAVLAALAVGTPLVTTPVGGTPEVLRDGENGLLVPVADAAALAAAIQRVRSDLSFACKLGQAGQTQVREHFTWDVTAAKLEAIYERTQR